MGTAANQRVAPGRVILILVLLLIVWLGFEFYPRKKPVPAMAPVQAESKLRSVGLPDNVDFEGLPELFAVWANDKDLTWSDDKTYFRYWNPVRSDYAYFVEATRTARGYHFKFIEERDAIPYDSEPIKKSDGKVYYDPDFRSPTHPFDFSDPPPGNLFHSSGPDTSALKRPPSSRTEPGKVSIDLKSDVALPMIQPVLRKPQAIDEKKQ